MVKKNIQWPWFPLQAIIALTCYTVYLLIRLNSMYTFTSTHGFWAICCRALLATFEATPVDKLLLCIKKNIQTSICKISPQASCLYQQQYFTSVIQHYSALHRASAITKFPYWLSLIIFMIHFYSTKASLHEHHHTEHLQSSTFKSWYWWLIVQLSCWHMYECSSAIHLLALTNRIRLLAILSWVTSEGSDRPGRTHKESRTTKRILSCALQKQHSMIFCIKFWKFSFYLCWVLSLLQFSL